MKTTYLAFGNGFMKVGLYFRAGSEFVPFEHMKRLDGSR